MKGAIFASNNGKGHIVRSASIANFLTKNFEIDLYLNFKKISKIHILKKIKKVNFEYGKVDKKIYNLKWYKKYNKINKYNFVISDNLPEAVNFNSKVFIYANFFWHNVLKVNHLKHFKKILHKLKSKKILIFGNYIFQNIGKNLNKKKIGFIGKYIGREKINKQNILISLGTAEINKKIEKKVLSDLNIFFKKINLSNYNIFIDKKYYLKFKKKFKNIKLAKYDKNNLSKMSLAIIKPGFGIINDCLRYGIPIINVNYKYNNEFIYNSKMLSKNKLNIASGNFNEITEKIKLIKLSKLNNMVKVYSKLKWEGEKELLIYLKKFLSPNI